MGVQLDDSGGRIHDDRWPHGLRPGSLWNPTLRRRKLPHFQFISHLLSQFIQRRELEGAVAQIVEETGVSRREAYRIWLQQSRPVVLLGCRTFFALICTNSFNGGAINNEALDDLSSRQNTRLNDEVIGGIPVKGRFH